MQSARVTDLAIYPVKSLAGVSLAAMPIGVLGPVGDRRFVITDEAGQFLTQRHYPQLCLVQVARAGDELVLNAPDRLALVLDARCATAARSTVLVWRDSIAACDMGEDAAAWFSEYLQRPARVYFMPDDSVRAVDPAYARVGDRVGFADGFPILLTTQASLDEFNRALPEPIGMERFRPNIVIGGTQPYAEDSWRRLRIGELEFDVVKPCSRCVIPSIDPRTAQKQPVVVKTLWELRRRDDNAVYFGQNVIHRGTGSIALGDVVTVLA